MALFRALSNPRATLKLEVASRKADAIPLLHERTDKPTEPLPLRRGAIREAVIEVLEQAGDALSPQEVHRRAARRLGRPVRRHTIDTSLAKVVTDPVTPIEKVGPARYAPSDDSDFGPQIEPVREQALAVLRSTSQAMRPAEVWSAIEAQTGEVMSYDAVANFLSLAARRPDLPIERVKRGWYRVT